MRFESNTNIQIFIAREHVVAFVARLVVVVEVPRLVMIMSKARPSCIPVIPCLGWGWDGME